MTTAAKWFINENVPVKLITESSGKEFLSSSSRKIQENALYGISVATSSALGSTFFDIYSANSNDEISNMSVESAVELQTVTVTFNKNTGQQIIDNPNQGGQWEN